jgi:RNase adaptor protein for sRNA GlmZ degradation
VEDVLECVDQRTPQNILKELNEKTQETQVNVHAVKMSPDMRMKGFLETIADTKKNLHEEFGFMNQLETKKTKVLVEAT